MIIATRPQDPPREVVPWGREAPTWPRPLKFVPLLPANRKLFWAAVMRHQLRRWEQLDNAIIGVGQVGDGPLVTVYSRRRILHELPSIIEPGELEWTNIEDFLTSLQTTNLGPLTPYIIHHEQD